MGPSARMLSSQPLPSISDLEIHVRDVVFPAHKRGEVSFLLPIEQNGRTNHLCVPLYGFSYWCLVHHIVLFKDVWQPALRWLQSRARNNPLAALALETINTLSWRPNLPGNMGDTVSLARYLGTEWLSWDNMDQCIMVLERDILASKDLHVAAMFTGANMKVRDMYRHEQPRHAYPAVKNVEHIDNLGNALRNNTLQSLYMTIPTRVAGGTVTLPEDKKGRHANHWVAVVITIQPQPKILYADPMGFPAPLELLEILRWWLKHYQEDEFELSQLLCTKQDDGYSCGILSVNAIRHHFFPDAHPLLDPTDTERPRLEAFMDAIKHAQVIVSLYKSRNLWSVLTVAILQNQNLVATAEPPRPPHQPFNMTIPQASTSTLHVTVPISPTSSVTPQKRLVEAPTPNLKPSTSGNKRKRVTGLKPPEVEVPVEQVEVEDKKGKGKAKEINGEGESMEVDSKVHQDKSNGMLWDRMFVQTCLPKTMQEKVSSPTKY